MGTRLGWIVLMITVAMLSATGCHRPEFIRSRTVAMDPPLVSEDPAFIQPRPATFVDRHPLLRKPNEYYHSSGPGAIHKVAAATFIGVPAGVLGEVRQIVVGCPPGF